MDVLETAFLEELVRGVGQVVTDAHDGRDQFCAATQMSLGTEIFVSVALGRQGVLVGWRVANKLAAVDCV